jgi:hypothetical protein
LERGTIWWLLKKPCSQMRSSWLTFATRPPVVKFTCTEN